MMLIVKGHGSNGGASGASGHEDASSMTSDASGHPSIVSNASDDAEARERLIPPKLLQLFADVEAGKNPSTTLDFASCLLFE